MQRNSASPLCGTPDLILDALSLHVCFPEVVPDLGFGIKVQGYGIRVQGLG